MIYINPIEVSYYSPRYKKSIPSVAEGYLSDGATGVADFYPKSWWVHDWICGNYLDSGPKPVGGQWEDGTPMTNWQLSHVFADIIRDEAEIKAASADNVWDYIKNSIGATILPITRFWGTWFFGGGEARKNGMW